MFNRKQYVREAERKAVERAKAAAQRSRKGAPIPESETYLQTVWRRFRRHRLAVVSTVMLAAIVLAALIGPLLLPYGPNQITPHFSAAPSAEHWLGTDQVGRDMLARVLAGTRISLLVGVAAAGVSTVVGVVLGLVAGYFGGVLDMIIMRVTDMVMSFPYILLVIVAASIFELISLRRDST